MASLLIRRRSSSPYGLSGILLLLVVFVQCALSVKGGSQLKGSFWGISRRGGASVNVDLEVATTTTATATLPSTNETAGIHAWRREFPAGLQNRTTLHRFSFPRDNVELYLLGTSHVSRGSSDDARQLMQHVQPDCLFLELCPNRVDLLFPPPLIKNVTKEKRGWFRRQSPVNCTNKDEEEATDGGEGGLRMGASLLSKMQAKYAQQMGVTIGGEFRTAYEESNEYSFNDENDKCVVVLGDRPVRITLVRVWQSLSWFGKCKLLLCLLWSCIVPVSSKALQEWMDSLLLNDNGVDLLTKSIADLEKYFPSLKRVIIDERDLYMSCKLLQLTFLLNQQRQAQQQRYQQQQQYQQYYHPQQAVETQEKGPLRIVAIVGAGHCPGMCRLLSNMTDQGSLQPANNYEPLLVPLIHTMSKSIDPTKAAELQELITGITVVQPDAISADAVAQ